jgi:hypothetical protein
MAVTMFERFCMMQNLRALMHSGLPHEIENLQSKFMEVFEGDNKGSALNDVWTMDTASLPQYKNENTWKALVEEEQQLMQAWLRRNGQQTRVQSKVLSQKYVQKFNMRFASWDSSRKNGDSNVVWGNLEEDSGPWHAGRIKSIFVSTAHSPNVFFIVDELEPLSDTGDTEDPWSSYKGSVAGRVFVDKVKATLVLSIDEVTCQSAVIPHFSGQPRQPNLHVIPLERVSSMHMNTS